MAIPDTQILHPLEPETHLMSLVEEKPSLDTGDYYAMLEPTTNATSGHFLFTVVSQAERSLLAAILFTSINDLVLAVDTPSKLADGKTNPKIKNRLDAIDFFSCRDTTGLGYRFSFLEICQYLDLEPRYILGHLRERGLLDIP